MKIVLLLLCICLISCHSDYYSDGCKKESWGAYLDYHGSIEWIQEMTWLELSYKEQGYAHRIVIESGYKWTQIDSMSYKIMMDAYRRDRDSSMKYHKLDSIRKAHRLLWGLFDED